MNARKTPNHRFADIAGLGTPVFHTDDVANLWRIRNRNTLSTTLSRYAAAGLIHRIHKGFYSIKKISELDPRLVGLRALHGPAYISCESVLFEQGLLNQPPREITLVGRISKRFGLVGERYRVRKLKEEFLVNDTGIESKNGLRVASTERAVADLLYFNPKKYFDILSPATRHHAQEIARAVGYSLKKNHDSAK